MLPSICSPTRCPWGEKALDGQLDQQEIDHLREELDGLADRGSLSAELEKAAELLRSKGMDHAAATLLAPEAEAKEAKVVAKVAAAEEKAAEKEADAPKPKRKYTKRAKVKAAAEPKADKPKKAKAKKEAKAKHKPVSGQSGPPIKGLTFEDLNKKEKLLLGCFELKGDREIRTISQLADEAFKTASVSVKKAESWVRNSLRRPIRSEPAWLEKTEPGSYRLTVYGRNQLKK